MHGVEARIASVTKIRHRKSGSLFQTDFKQTKIADWKLHLLRCRMPLVGVSYDVVDEQLHYFSSVKLVLLQLFNVRIKSNLTKFLLKTQALNKKRCDVALHVKMTSSIFDAAASSKFG